MARLPPELTTIKPTEILKKLPVEISNKVHAPVNLTDTGNALDQLPVVVRDKIRHVIPPAAVGRPSTNLGHIFNSQLHTVDLSPRIATSNPIPFLAVKMAQTKIMSSPVVHRIIHPQPLPVIFRQAVKKLRGE